MNIRSCLAVLWSGIVTLVQAACVAALLTGGFVLLLLPLGWTRSDLLWRLGSGAAAVLQSMIPAAVFLALRHRPLYPLDSVGLFLAPVAVPFALTHFAHVAFAFCFGVQLTRSADAILLVGGCAFVLVGPAPFARLFLLYVRWPSPSTHAA